MQEHRDRMKSEPIVDRHPGHVRVARKGQDDAVKWPLRFWAVLGVALLSLACCTAGWGEDGRDSKTVPGTYLPNHSASKKSRHSERKGGIVPDPRLGAPEPVAASCAGADLSGLQTAIYVSPQGNDSADCGASPSTACQTVQQGINNCGATGCGVLVRHGLYQTSETIQLRDGVSVYGSCVFDGEADNKYRTVVQALLAGWGYAGTTGISGNNSDFTKGNPPAPEGVQVAFIQGQGGSSSSIAQSLFVSQGGLVQVMLRAAQRGNCCGQGGSAQDFEVLIDNTSLGVFRPSGTSYEEVTTAASSVTAGAHTLKLVGRNSAGGDNTVFVDNVRVQVGNTSLDVVHFGFEQPQVGDGVFHYNPTDAAMGTPVISGSAINTATTLYGFVVLGSDATSPGAPSLAMTVSDSKGLTISHTVLASGQGGDGAALFPGQAGQGTGGSPGSVDFDSEEGSGGSACSGSTTSGAGGGGAGWRENSLSGCFAWCVCNASGGAGGGQGGQSGNVGGGPPGGPGGDARGCTGSSGTAGTGGPGQPGSAGACSPQGGTANANIWGSFATTSWMPSSGGMGGSGNVGSGGGGGGAGGLCATGDGQGNWIPQWGFPGGGGGGGGCGGIGGPGGQQGGASIPLVLFNASVTLVPDQNSLISGPGGRGGDGGQGGIGGPGGGGGPGGSNASACGLIDTSRSIGWAGFGGPGGDGGQGGAGSGGAGGNGGPSIGIALLGGSPMPGNGDGIYLGQPGAAGSKGAGGQNASSSTDPTPCQGAEGQDGVAGGTAAIGPNTMIVNEELTPGQSRTSSDGRYLFILQTDGNLCLYGPSGFLWCSNTAGQNTQTAIMQADGNFCLHNQGGNVFCTNTVTNPDAYLTVQDDGDVVIYSGTTRLWATNTAQQ